MAKKQINTLGLTTAQAIQLLRVHNPALTFQGFADISTALPAAHTLNHAWIATETGSVFGIAVEKGQVIRDNGSTYVAEKLNRTKPPLSFAEYVDWKLSFNGINSFISINEPIVLESEGDYVEFYVKVISGRPYTGGYNFAGGFKGGGFRGIALTAATGYDGVIVRADDSTNLIGSGGQVMDTPRLFNTQFYNIKIAFESGVVKVYYDGVLVGQGTESFKKTTINNFGFQTDLYPAWQGYVGEVSWNTATGIGSYKNLMSASLSDYGNIEFDLSAHRFLSTEQQAEINAIALKADSNELGVKAVMDYIVKDNYFSRYNTTGDVSTTSLSNPMILANVGDYVEVKWKVNKTVSGYANYLYILSGTGVNMGYYNASSIWLKDVSGGSYKTWAVSVNRTDWHAIKLEVVAGGWELFVNGVSQGVQPKDGNFEIATVSQGAQYYDVHWIKFNVNSEISEINPLATHIGSENVLLAEFIETVQDDTYAKGYLTYIAGEKFIAYIQDKSGKNIYYGFEVILNSSKDEEYDPNFYKHHWELASSRKYTFDGTTMSETGNVLAEGESECVIKMSGTNGSKVDFTGGVHGDERIDIDPNSFVNFYIDGIKLSATELSSSFELRECNEFMYIQRSTLHNTAEIILNKDTGLAASGAGVLTINGTSHRFEIDGVDTGITAYSQNGFLTSTSGLTLGVSGSNTWTISEVVEIDPNHTIIAEHFKKTVFKNSSYETYNRLEFLLPDNMLLWYHGICCVHKDCSQFGHNEEFAEVEFTSSGAGLTEKTGLRLFEGYNPTNKQSSRVTSRIISGFDDALPVLFVSDRTSDSKYYRRTPAASVANGTKMESEMVVEFKSN